MTVNPFTLASDRNEKNAFPVDTHALGVLAELMAGGEILPAQLASTVEFTPEKRLAAAVLASALVEVRDHHGSRSHQRRVAEALEWIASDDVEWPFSFLRLCALFDIEPAWARGMVRQWTSTSPATRKPVRFLYRNAA